MNHELYNVRELFQSLPFPILCFRNELKGLVPLLLWIDKPYFFSIVYLFKLIYYLLLEYMDGLFMDMLLKMNRFLNDRL
jgi:hypothetical protein